MPDDGIGARALRYRAVFALLYVPLGITNGYIGVTLGYLLAHAGISTATIGGVMAVGISMQIWKFLWAPLIDMFFSYRRWFLLSTSMLAGTILCGGLIAISPTIIPAIVTLNFVLGLSSSLGAIAADGLIAHSTSIEDKGRAGGWAQSKWGSVGMLFTEASVGAIAIMIFVTVRIATAPRVADALA